MKVNLGSIEVTDHLRRALNAHYGEKGLATRQSVRDACHAFLRADLETVEADYEQGQRDEAETKAEAEAAG